MRLDMLFSKNRATGRLSAYQGQTNLLAQGIL
jgi:hypothetical protein